MALAVAGTLVTIPVSGQGSGTPALVVTAFGGQKVDYKTPRTPWGDPDLQGTWSSDDMSNVPMSRAQQFGDRLYLNDKEFAARQAQVERGMKQCRDQRGQHIPCRFRQTRVSPDVAHRRSAGRAHAGSSRLKRRSGARRAIGAPSATARSIRLTDFTLYDRCITRGIVGSVHAGDLRQRKPDRPVAGRGRDQSTR